MPTKAETDNLDVKLESQLAHVKKAIHQWLDKKEKDILEKWLKKLGDDSCKTVLERKNRNLYAQILNYMLATNHIKEPFTKPPLSGNLPTIPAYMGSYLNESISFHTTKDASKQDGESEWYDEDAYDNSLLLTSLNVSEESFRRYKNILSPRKREKFLLTTSIFEDDSLIENQTNDIIHQGNSNHVVSSNGISNHAISSNAILNHVVSSNGKIDLYDNTDANELEQYLNYDEDMMNDITNNIQNSHQEKRKTAREEYKEFYEKKRNTKISVKSDEKINVVQTTIKRHTNNENENKRIECKSETTRERELEFKIRLLESKIQEETLRVEQKHDQMVKKILDRKNNEINEVRVISNKKISELQTENKTHAKKVNSLTLELTQVREKHTHEVDALKDTINKTSSNTAAQYEHLMYEKLSGFENEIFNLQKTHRQNIQEVLSEANEKLKYDKQGFDREKQRLEMDNLKLKESLKLCKENEINYQIVETNSTKEKDNLFSKNQELLSTITMLNNKLNHSDEEQNKLIEEYETTVKELRTKSEQALHDIQNERSQATKMSSTMISDLETKIQQYRQTVTDMELSNNNKLQEEINKHEHELNMANSKHENKIFVLQREYNTKELEYEKEIKKYELRIKEKEEEVESLVKRTNENIKETELHVERFKKQADEESSRIFQDLNNQLVVVQNALQDSKETMEKQRKEFVNKFEREKESYQQKFDNYKQKCESEKLRLHQNYKKEKELIIESMSKDKEDLLKEHENIVKDSEHRYKKMHTADAKVIKELESQVNLLREEVIEANNLRKQQMQEISHLREEEKKSSKRTEENLRVNFKSKEEQLRQQLQKNHSTTLKEYTEKMEKRLKDLTEEYRKKSSKDLMTINELRSRVEKIGNELKQKSSLYDGKLKAQETVRTQNEVVIKEKHEQYLETQQIKFKQLEKKFKNLELSCQEKVSRCRLDCEEKLKGMLPLTVRQELEDTIATLRQQIDFLQRRAKLLEGELETSTNIVYGTRENKYVNETNTVNTPS